MRTQHIPRRTNQPCSGRDDDPRWKSTLPTEWRSAAISPLTFANYRDYEIPASRTLGYDEDGTACYYRHVYILSVLCSDDDDEFYETIAYGEEVEGWRLRDTRWLVWRILHEDGGCRGNRGFFSFSEEMPT